MNKPKTRVWKRQQGRILTLLLLALLPVIGSFPALASETHKVDLFTAESFITSGTIDSDMTVLAANDSDMTVLDAKLRLGPRAGETDFLPAWRWQNIDLDQDSGGFLGPIKTMPNAIAMIMFAFANFLWQVLLNITKLGLSADFITPAAPAINAGVAQLGELVFIFGALILAVVFWKGIRGWSKGDGVSSFFRVFICLIWLLGILGIQRVSADAAESFDSKADRRVSAEAQASYPGTLPWMLRTVTTSVDKTASGLVNTWGLRERMAGSATGALEASTAGDVLTCDNYISTIHQQYLDYQMSGGGKPANATLAGMSNLWESTLYRSWTVAQFSTPNSGTDIGARVMCHYAEQVNDIPAAEQATIAALAYKTGPFATGTVLKVFGPHIKDETRRRAVVAWANCQLVGGKMSATPETNNTFGNSVKSHDDDCASTTEPFSTNKDGMDGKYLDLFGNSEDAFGIEGKESELENVRKWENAWFGSNSAERVLNALLSLLVALGMVWSLGFIAIGLVLVQFTMVILLLFVPVLLVLIAIDVKSDKAIGLFKLLGTSTFTKAFFGVLIALIIEIAAIGQGIVDYIPGGGGLFGQILKGLMPLAALLMVRKILSSFGMQDIMRPMGAVSFATAAAVSATGRDPITGARGNSTASMFNNAVNRTALSGTGAGRLLSKADRYSPLLENWNKEGRTARRSAIDEERSLRRGKRSDERENRGDGAFDRMKDWANSRGWNLDRAEDTLASGAKGAALAGAGIISGGAAPLFTGILAGAAAGRKISEYSKLNSSKKDIDLEGLPEVSLGADGTVSAGVADAQLREYKRRRTQADRSGRGADSVDVEMIDGALSGHLSNRFGADFEGFESEQHALGSKASFAKQRGYDFDDVLVSSNGVILPNPVAQSERNTLTTDQMSDWVHWLPETDATRKEGESNDDYISRLFATGVSRGLVTEDGSSVDVWNKLGLDMKNKNDLRRVESFLRGDRDDSLLSNTVFESRNSSAERIMIAQLQGQTAGTRVSDRRDQHNVVAMQRAINSVRKDLSGKLNTTSTMKTELDSVAQILISAQNSLREELDSTTRATLQIAVNEQRDKFQAQVDSLNKHILDVAQDLVCQRADLLVGTNEIIGHEQLEQFLSDELKVHLESIEKIEQARDGVVLGRSTSKELMELSTKIEKDMRSRAADLIGDAGWVAEQMKERFAKMSIESDRIGSTTTQFISTRDLVDQIGADRFPSASSGGPSGKKERVR